MTSEPAFGACPDPETLSAYLDGRLDPTESGRIEGHVSACEDCYFVVRETAFVRAEAGTGESAPARASSFVRYLMPIAATLLMAAGTLALWRQSQSSADPGAGLVAAVGERRFFDARLTGGFKFGERVSPRRGNDPIGAAREDWEVLAAAAKVRQDLVAPTGGREVATLAASHLFLGEVDQGIELLQQAVVVPGVAGRERANLLSDLSAALLIRGIQRNDAGDIERALASADAALQARDNLPEALHNRALALEALGRPADAATAWEACAAKETDPRWREEALRRRAGLSGR